MRYQAALQQYPKQLHSWWQQTPSNAIKNTIRVMLLGLIALALMLATGPSPITNSAPEKAKLVSVVRAQLQSVSPNLSLLGTVTTSQKSILTAAVTAQIKTVMVQEGDSVVKGQMLVQLDPSDYELKVLVLSAQLRDISAQLASNKLRQKQSQQQLIQQQKLIALAQGKVHRQQKLNTDNLVSQNQYDEAKANLARQQLALSEAKFLNADLPLQGQSLEAQKQHVQSRWQQAKLELQRCEVRAPFNARISQVFVSNGAQALPGNQLLSLYNPDRLEVTAQIPETALTLLKAQFEQQDKAKATSKIDEHIVQLQLNRLAAQVTEGGSIDGFFRFVDTVQFDLGQTVNLLLDLPQKESVILLPVSAVYRNDHVFVVEQQRLRSLAVTVVGERLGNQGELHLLLRSDENVVGKSVLVTAVPQAVTGLKVKVSL